MGSGPVGERSCVTDVESTVTCGDFGGFDADFDAHPVITNSARSVTNRSDRADLDINVFAFIPLLAGMYQLVSFFPKLPKQFAQVNI